MLGFVFYRFFSLSPRKIVLAAFHHYNSTRENPNHDYCDPKKCHFYQKKNFDHEKHSIAPAVMKAILPVYEKMCSDATLSKVVDGGTTNCNESFHSYIWSLCPKTQFHSARYVRNAASLATVLFNDGYCLSIDKLMKACGIRSDTSACFQMSTYMDRRRIKEQTIKTAAARQQRRQKRLITDQRLDDQEKYPYARGAFD